MVVVDDSNEPVTLYDVEMEDLDADDLVGLSLRDTYTLTRLLGEGGMARVYEARHTRIPAKRYAIKVLRIDMTAHGEIAARFEREAHAIASVVHPNIVDVIDIGLTPSRRPYIVTEYLDGTDLAGLLREVGTLPPPLATHIARQVCRGISAAHACGVIHRDLKPENVFLTGDRKAPRAKVLDFGLARMVETRDITLTRSGIVMGTPAYMSPEQARAERADERSDVYGIGALLYVMLTGKQPYSEATPQATVLAVMAGEPPRPRSLVSSIPQRLEGIVQRAMARDPAERFATALELEAELTAYDVDTHAAELRMSAPPPSLSGATQASEHDRTRLVAVAALGAGLLFLWLAMAASTGLRMYVLHRTPTELELLLVALTILGTVATPALLLLRHFRRRIWNNSARIAELLMRTRAVVYSAIVAYGLSALAVRAHDFWRLPRAATGGAAWDVLLCGVAVLVGAAAALRGVVLGKRPGRLRRFVAGPVIGVATLTAAVFIVRAGFIATPAASLAPATAPPPPALSTAPPPNTPPTPSSPPSASAVLEAPDAAPEPERATIAELEAAKQSGLSGWRRLVQRYPADPHVLLPLALAYGEKPDSYADAVGTLKKLFAVDRVTAKDEKVRTLLVKLAFSDGQTEQALALMAEDMGAAGPDLLYDLYVTAPAVRGRARELLQRADVREHATPALLVAFDVRSAASCEARLAELPRAEKDGDERTIAVLTMLSSNTKKGCGWKKRRPCPPPCAKQAAAFRDAAAQIRSRLEK